MANANYMSLIGVCVCGSGVIDFVTGGEGNERKNLDSKSIPHRGAVYDGCQEAARLSREVWSPD